MSETTRLRIISDGTPGGTKVMTEDGRIVKGVQLVAWHLGIGEFARCMIEFRAVAVDMVGEYEGSLPEDPTAVVVLAEPQDPPEGPGFTEGGVVRAIAEVLAPEVREDYVDPDPPPYVCPICGTLHDDVDMFCTGDDIIGTHEPFRVEERGER